MNNPRFNAMRCLFLTSVTTLSLIGSAVAYGDPVAAPPATISSPQAKSEALSQEDVQRFSTAITEIKKFYVKDVDNSKLFDDAIRGMLAGLDPHSGFLDADEYQDLRSQTNGEFGGLGIEVTAEGDYIRVVSPIDDTPAAKAGIKPGDLIIRINNKPVDGLALSEAVKEMRGKAGTTVNLTLYRKSEKQPIALKLTREIIQISSVKSKLLENGYGYIRISQFQAPTATKLMSAITALNKESTVPLKGLILDLRNNPGGLLDSAVSVSNLFLDSDRLPKDNKLIVYTKGRIPAAQYSANATRNDATKGIPMIVLINEGSASASEIVAGALQDHKRAIIMGTQSFGKGSVQTVLPLDSTRGLKLTTALYYTPSGRSIQAMGIKPDVIVKPMDVKNTKSHVDISSLKESDLGQHLANGNSIEKQTTALASEQKSEQQLATEDYQLHEALLLLKGLSVANNQRH